MEFAFLMLERRQSETLSDLVGGQLGTLWTVDQLTSNAAEPRDETKFTWSLREKPAKLSTPLTTIIAAGSGLKLMDQLKKLASKTQLRNRPDPSVYKMPRRGYLDGAEIIDLSKVSKDQFLKFAKRV